MNVSEAFIENYFLTLAIQARFIGHTTESPAFFRIKSKVDPDSFDNAVKSIKKDVVLLLEIGAGAFGEYDSPTDAIRIGLHLLYKTDERFLNANAARDLAKDYLVKLISRIRHDCSPKYMYSPTAEGPLYAVNIVFDSKVKYDDMDEIDGNWYGKCAYFEWRTPISFVYDANLFLP